ncbi:MAG TPA: NAD(P)-dependent oxidoreductase [Acidimicrobiales bacterium]|nr:NAD(P)-dependent oxidoreductase [Acidimicrobiales bacterium]
MPDTSPRALGFVGLGNIGGPLCANLAADGHEVAVFDVDRGRLDAAAAAGANPADSVGAVAASSTCTFLSLPTPSIMEAVAAQWLADAPPRAMLVDLTTNAPSTVRAVGARVDAGGARLVEAPVTGGAVGARDRKLVFIVGGADEDVAEVAPLLESMGRAWFHLGPLGCGNVGKLVNSLMAFTTMWVSLEGLALAAKNDIDLRTLVDMVRTSGGATPYLDRRVEEIAVRNRPAQFAMELAAKDAGLMLEVGRDVGVPLPVASALHQMLSYAKAQGLGDHDISDLVEVMEHAANVELRLRPADPG